MPPPENISVSDLNGLRSALVDNFIVNVSAGNLQFDEGELAQIMENKRNTAYEKAQNAGSEATMEDIA